MSYRDGKHWYLDNVPRFITYLDEVLPRHAELAPLIDLLDQQIKPALAARMAHGNANGTAA